MKTVGPNVGMIMHGIGSIVQFCFDWKRSDCFKQGNDALKMQFVLIPAIVIQTERSYSEADQVNREIAKRISHGVVNDDPKTLSL